MNCRHLYAMIETNFVSTGRSVSSQELVPGDVYEFSDPSINQVPCDCILLSGDCIVNESMLTGSFKPKKDFTKFNQSLL